MVIFASTPKAEVISYHAMSSLLLDLLKKMGGVKNPSSSMVGPPVPCGTQQSELFSGRMGQKCSSGPSLLGILLLLFVDVYWLCLCILHMTAFFRVLFSV